MERVVLFERLKAAWSVEGVLVLLDLGLRTAFGLGLVLVWIGWGGWGRGRGGEDGEGKEGLGEGVGEGGGGVGMGGGFPGPEIVDRVGFWFLLFCWRLSKRVRVREGGWASPVRTVVREVGGGWIWVLWLVGFG